MEKDRKSGQNGKGSQSRVANRKAYGDNYDEIFKKENILKARIQSIENYCIVKSQEINNYDEMREYEKVR